MYSFILLTVGLLVYAGIRPLIERRVGAGAGAEVYGSMAYHYTVLLTFAQTPRPGSSYETPPMGNQDPPRWM